MEIQIPYEPRPLQQDLHRNVKRFNVIVCHRRFGKTIWSVNEIIAKSLECPHKNPQYAYIAPTYGQAKRVAWDMFKDATECFRKVRTINEAELRIDIQLDKGRRLRFLLLGAENPDSLKGLYLDGVILDEYALMYPTVWSEVIRPTLSDRRGWACFVGTPKGANHFKDIYDEAIREGNEADWYRCLYKASATDVIHPEEIKALKREYTNSPELYEQEYECDFGAALVGAYYGKQMKDAQEADPCRITSVPYDRGFAVFTAWDLGIDDHTAIWFFQWVGRELRAINYYENNDFELDHYAKFIKDTEYNFQCHILPHDAAARSLETGITIQQKLWDLGLGRAVVMEKCNPVNMLDEVRRLLSMCWFDKNKTEQGRKCLENYERKYDTKTKRFSGMPLHNWASHGADAFKTFAQYGRRSQTDSTFSINRNLPTTSITEYDIFGG